MTTKKDTSQPAKRIEIDDLLTIKAKERAVAKEVANKPKPKKKPTKKPVKKESTTDE